MCAGLQRVALAGPLFAFVVGCAEIPEIRTPEAHELRLVTDLLLPLRAVAYPDHAACIAIAQTKKINASVGPPTGPCMFTLSATEGILKALSAEDLQGIFAHEIAHYTLGHMEKYQARNAKSSWAKLFFQTVSYFTLIGWAVGTIGSVTTDMIRNAYTRDDEQAADLEGARILTLASTTWTGPYRPTGCSQIIHAYEQMQRHLGEQAWANFFGDHPSWPSRLAVLKTSCADQSNPTPAQD